MKASELVAEVEKQIARHGDLEIMVDCDSLLLEPGTVQYIHAVYLPQPLLVIMPQADADDENADPSSAASTDD